jgi:hypothetical protein
MKKFFLIVLVVACSSSRTAPDVTPVQRLSELQVSLERANNQHATFAATGLIVGREYTRLFTLRVREKAIRAARPADLAALLDAANIATFYTLEPTHARHALEAFDALGERATVEQRDAMRKMLVKTRVLDPHPGLDLPVVVDLTTGPGPTELVVEQDRVVRRTVDLKGEQILVAAVPGCHFAANAIAAIDADPALRAAFAGAHWLVPQEVSGDVDEARDTRFTLAFNRDEFPMIDEWDSPTFYFLRDGAVVAKVVGWPAEGRLQDLRDAVAVGMK